MKMRKLILNMSALAMIALAFQSCSSDPCKDKSAATLCSGKGTLVDKGGSCQCNCNAGYTGSSCSTLISSELVGAWSCIDQSNRSNVAPVTYTSIAYQSLSDSTKLTMPNFSDLGSAITVDLTFTSSTSFTMENKNLTSQYTLSDGSGTITTTSSGRKLINATYKITPVGSPSSAQTYTCVWTKN